MGEARIQPGVFSHESRTGALAGYIIHVHDTHLDSMDADSMSKPASRRVLSCPAKKPNRSQQSGVSAKLRSWYCASAENPYSYRSPARESTALLYTCPILIPFYLASTTPRLCPRSSLWAVPARAHVGIGARGRRAAPRARPGPAAGASAAGRAAVRAGGGRPAACDAGWACGFGSERARVECWRSMENRKGEAEEKACERSVHAAGPDSDMPPMQVHSPPRAIPDPLAPPAVGGLLAPVDDADEVVRAPAAGLAPALAPTVDAPLPRAAPPLPAAAAPPRAPRPAAAPRAPAPGWLAAPALALASARARAASASSRARSAASWRRCVSWAACSSAAACACASSAAPRHSGSVSSACVLSDWRKRSM